MKRGRGLVAALLAVVARPRLWVTALRQVRTLAAPGWWRRPPFLPLPDTAWMEFRLTTAYGDAKAPLAADDVVVWLDWSRRQHRSGPETPDLRTGVRR